MFENCDVVKTGTAIYEETVSYGVRIVKSPIQYGTGDYEDSPEICNDIEQDFFYIIFEDMSNRGFYCGGAGGGNTLDGAINLAEQLTNGTVRWD